MINNLKKLYYHYIAWKLRVYNRFIECSTTTKSIMSDKRSSVLPPQQIPLTNEVHIFHIVMRSN